MAPNLLPVPEEGRMNITMIGNKISPPTAAKDSAILLDRSGNLLSSSLLIGTFFALEISKQMFTYSLARNNDGHYPVPATLLLAATELTKLVVVVLAALISGSQPWKFRASPLYSIPAACYLTTGFCYLWALQSVSPPLWMVLIQTRTLYTTAMYKVVFGRRVSRGQMMGCALIVCSIPLAKLTDIVSVARESLTGEVLCVSQLCAVLSTVASVAVEVLLKNDSRSFLEQQTWLYAWGLFGCLISIIFLQSTEGLVPNLKLLTNVNILLILGGVSFTASSGLCIPLIVRRLDTVVKDYLGAANNILLSAVTSILFPTLFYLSWPFVFSISCLVAGVLLYERGVRRQDSSSSASTEISS